MRPPVLERALAALRRTATPRPGGPGRALLAGPFLILVACTSAPVAGPDADAHELVRRADGQLDGRQTLAALESYKLAALAARSDGDSEVFVEAASGVAAAFALDGQPDAGVPWLEQAGSQVDEEQPRAWMRYVFARGLVHRASGREARALADFEAAYGVALEHVTTSEGDDRDDYVALAMRSAHMASTVAAGRGKVVWGERLVQISEASGNEHWRAAALTSLGWIHDGLGEPVEALAAFRESRALVHETGDARARLKADWAYGRALRLSGRELEAAAVMERTKLAAERLHATLFSPADAEWVARCHQELGELALAAGDLDLAIRHLQVAHQRYVQADAPSLAPDVLRDVEQRLREVAALRKAVERPGGGARGDATSAEAPGAAADARPGDPGDDS